MDESNNRKGRKMKDFKDYIVPKPWGKEYLLFRNGDVAIWILNINFNEKTSMHCHPKKNTGLVVMDGSAKVQFLNSSYSLKSLDKIMIFKGHFHSTTCLSKSGLTLLEIESPEDKNDLVRLNDNYGRANNPYESEDTWLKRTKNEIFIDSVNKHQQHVLSGCVLKIINNPSKEDLIDKDYNEMFIILKGGLETSKKEGILSPGDVVSSQNMTLLVNKFNISENTEIMHVIKK